MTMRLSSLKTIPVDHGYVLISEVEWIAIATDVEAIFLWMSVWNLLSLVSRDGSLPGDVHHVTERQRRSVM
jgi:hypothetical protein